MVHAERLQPTVGNRVAGRHRDDGGHDRERVLERQVELGVGGVHERIGAGLDLGGPRIDVVRARSARGDELAARRRVGLEEGLHAVGDAVRAGRSVLEPDEMALVAHDPPDLEARGSGGVGERTGVLRSAAAAGHADVDVEHDLGDAAGNGGVDRGLGVHRQRDPRQTVGHQLP